MNGYHLLIAMLLLVSSQSALGSIKDSRTALHIPEKILGGVIEIVNSHKNKPGHHQPQGSYQNQGSFQQQSQTQASYQNQANFQGQGSFQQNTNQGSYPQQWNPPQNFQNQGYYQGQLQAQGQFSASNQGQNFNYQPGSSFPGGNQFQGQNQYGNYPQNQNPQGNFGVTQPNNMGLYQGSQNSGQFQVVYPQNQSGSSPSQGVNQQTQGSYAQTGNQQGQGTFQQTISSGSNQLGSGVQTSGAPGAGGNGPTCVCQAWTKPGEELNPGTPVGPQPEKKD